MNMTAIRDALLRVLTGARRLALSLALIGAGAILGYAGLRWTGGAVPPAHAAETPTETPEAKGEKGIVRMPEARWPVAGIRIASAGYAPFTEHLQRTGRLTLNETRMAHLAPLAEGVIREVKVRLGQDVRAGDVLAVIDSREVGQVKLELARARLASATAEARHAWTQQTSRNAGELVAAMTAGTPLTDLENGFKNRPIGDLRQQLVTTYSRWVQARTKFQTVSQPSLQAVLPKTNLIRTRSEYEVAGAAFRALCEEVAFQAKQQVRTSEAGVRDAQTAEALARARLLMLGYTAREVNALDPVAEGAAVSLYSIRAPFDGTIVEQHAVLAERVGPDLQMFRLADLSTLWLRADIPQKDLALIHGLAGGKIRFRTADGAGTDRQGVVFYTGDVVDEQTRTVPLTATVANPGRDLKPGVFVEVELEQAGAMAIQVPETAIQRDGAQPFVFVHEEGDAFRRVDVTIARTSGGVAEVARGLQPGQPVVVAGGFVLKSELFKDQMAGD